MAVTRTKDVTIADAWANDEGGVTVAVGKRRAHLTVEEATALGADIVTSAAEALRATQEMASGEQTIRELAARMKVPTSYYNRGAF